MNTYNQMEVYRHRNARRVQDARDLIAAGISQNLDMCGVRLYVCARTHERMHARSPIGGFARRPDGPTRSLRHSHRHRPGLNCVCGRSLCLCALWPGSLVWRLRDIVYIVHAAWLSDIIISFRAYVYNIIINIIRNAPRALLDFGLLV